MRRLLACALLVMAASAQTLSTVQTPLFNTLRSGIGAPSNPMGNNGDFYIDATPGARTLYGPKYANSWPTGVSMIGSGGTASSQLVSKSSAYTTGLTDGTVVCDTRSASVSIALDTTPVNSETHRIKVIGTHNCTILGNGNLIDSVPSLVLAGGSFASVDVQWDDVTAGANAWRTL